MGGRLGGRPEVDLPADQGHGDAAILRRTRLGDVHAADYFQAHHHGRPVTLVQAAHLPQHAIDAVADPQEGFLGLKVDVGGFALYSVGQQRIDQPHHGVAVLVLAGLQAVEVQFAGFNLTQNAVDRELKAVDLLDDADNLRLAAQHCLNGDVAAVQGADLVERHDVEGVSHRQGKVPGLRIVGQRQDGVAPGQILRHDANGSGVDDRVCKIHTALANVLTEYITHQRIGDKAQLDQHGTQRLVGLFQFQ